MTVPDKPRPQRTTPLGVLRSVSETEAADFASGSASVLEGSGLYRLLVDSVMDYAIFALDAGGNILSWNAGAQRLKGYTPDEIIGKHFTIFYPPEDVARGKTDIELEIATRDGRVEDEGWRVRKDGTRFWANVVITALRDSDGTLVGFAKVTRDLTERRAAEQALRLSEERFRTLVQGVRDYAIFMLDTQGRVASWNEGAQRINGYAAGEIMGRHFSTFYPAEDVAAGKTEMELEVAVRDGKYEEEGWRVRKDGSHFWAHVLITALRDFEGRLVGYAKVTRDLTERKAAQEREIADARRITEIETASRTKSEFLAAMSHELRTPINATLGYADLLEMEIAGPVTDQQREYLKRIRGSQQHLLRIVNDLLNYSRIEAGQVEYDITPFSLHDAVEAVLAMVEPLALAKGIFLKHGPCPDEIVAMADMGKTEQIVLNLLSNAVKFTPNGGRVTASCGTQDGVPCVTVSDTGPGIPAEHQHSIFQPFVQLGRSLTSGHEGTGLGLAISRDLARAMGGEITLRSGPGEGATFTLTLPPEA
ncbi:MAG TPA: PAS domain-containing sensor histidine kinase [Longimicrobium sp.]|jgi:PAS domain S-box-containing protein|uniref:PAS domain-containing sensor histidine kinase n=1 Tax=Longimicrobium sp. TaxID=2029185 RepID=UPI002ED8C11E